MKTDKYTVLSRLKLNERVYEAGKVVELDDELAATLISSGAVQKTEPKKDKS